MSFCQSPGRTCGYCTNGRYRTRVVPFSRLTFRILHSVHSHRALVVACVLTDKTIKESTGTTRSYPLPRGGALSRASLRLPKRHPAGRRN